MKIYVNNIFKLKSKDLSKKKEKSKQKQVKKLAYDNTIKDIICNKKLNNNEVTYKNHEEESINLKRDKIIKLSNYSNVYVRKGANKGYVNKKNKVKHQIIDDNKNDCGHNKNNLPKSYYTLLFFMIILASVSIKLVVDSNTIALEEDYAVFNNNDELDENYKEEVENVNQNINSSNVDTRDEFESVSSITTTTTATSTIDKVQEKIDNVVQKKVEPLVFIKPIDGEISKIFSDDKLIYSKTLEMWKTHDGIDIKGNIGDIVYSIERGEVEKVYEDAFYGVTIVINHGQGYKSSYSNLDSDTFVKEGESIKKSQKLVK